MSSTFKNGTATSIMTTVEPPSSFLEDPTISNGTGAPFPTTITIIEKESPKDKLVRGLLSGLLGIGCGLLLFGIIVLIFCIYRWFARRRHLALLDRLGIMVERRNNALQQRIDRRYETIEHWLITKKTMEHGDFCRKVCCEIVPNSPPFRVEKQDKLHQDAGDTAEKSATPSQGDVELGETPAETPVQEHENEAEICYFRPRSDEEYKNEEKECPICMNEFQLGETVSWSANPRCSHVYHHECIKEWLLRKTGCPFCRETFLPCDSERGRAKKDQLQEMSKRYASRHSTSFYCMHEGLVALPPTVRCTLTELSQLKDRIFDSAIAPKDLVSLRGERQEGTVSALVSGKDDCEDNDGNGLGNGNDNIEEPSENPDIGDNDEDVIAFMSSAIGAGNTSSSPGRQRNDLLRREETQSALTVLTDGDEEEDTASDLPSDASDRV